jgi:acyl transferase domain-containing protein/acyl carrier protein
MGDVVGTLAKHRAHLANRVAVVADSRSDLIRKLRAFADGSDSNYREASPPCLVSGRRRDDPVVAFAFSGQGSQWYGMARQLLARDEVFRRAVEEVDGELARLGDWSVIEELGRPRAMTRIDQTIVTQGCIFAVQVGLLARWRAWGIEPKMAFGHSLGEVAAAYAASALTLRDAARVVHYRSTLHAETEGTGAIVAVGMSVEAVQEHIAARGDPEVEIAAINSNQLVTISGEKRSVAALLNHLKNEDQDLFYRHIRMNFAPHSPQMEPLKNRYLTALEDLKPQATTVPLISTVTGERISGRELDADYWWRAMRSPVLFQNALQSATELGGNLFLEVGPDARDRHALYSALGALDVSGATLEWDGIVEDAYRLVALPGYPWEYEEFWFDGESARKELMAPTPHPLLGKRLDLALPTWESEVSMKGVRFLNDHKINGSYLFPAAGYIEMMFAVGRELFGDGPLTLDDVEFVRAIFLSTDRTELFQVSYDPDRRRVSIRSRPNGADATWELRAHATMTHPGTGAIPSIRPPSPLKGKTVYGAKRFYEMAAKFGYEYGGAFRGISKLSRRGERVAADLKRPTALRDHGRYVYAPPFLDCLLQSSIAFLLGDEGKKVEEGGVIFQPRSVRRIRLHGSPTQRLRLQMTRISVSMPWALHDIGIFNTRGNSVIQMEGFATTAVPRGEEDLDATAIEARFYTERWIRSDIASDDGLRDPGTWLVFADRHGIGRAAARALRRQGHTCVLVDGNGTYRLPKKRAAKIDSGRREDFVRLLEDIHTLGPPVKGVMYLWALDHSGGATRMSASRLHRVQSAVTMPALSLVQALAELSSSGLPRLIFATSGAKSVQSIDDLTVQGLSLSPLGGFCRTVFAEYPALQSTHIDLDRSLVDARALAGHLVDEGLAAEAKCETEVAFRDGRRYVPRLGPRSAADLKPKARPAVSSRGSHQFALIMKVPGDLDRLAIVETEPAKPGAGEVAIAVRAVGLNFRDIMAATGLLPPDAEPDPAWENLGLECSGIVEAVGEGVERLKVGDLVVANGIGCLRSQLVVPEVAVWKIPDGISHVEAATIATAFSTAYYSLVTLGKIRKGERVLIHLGTGGVGLAAIQIAQMVGAEIFTTAGSPKKRAYLRRLGIKHVMNSRSLEFADQIMAKTKGRGVDIVLNALAGAAIDKGLSILAPCGRFLEIGKRDIYGDSPLGMRALRKNASFFAVDMGRMGEDNPEALADVFSEIGALLENGSLRPLPAEVFPLNRAIDAFDWMAKARHIGKVVVTVEPTEVQAEQSTEAPISFDSDGAYLVTGGLGGFGSEVAAWMARRDAGHLYLVGRSGGTSKAARRTIRCVEKAGAEVTALAADITKRSDVQAVFERISEDGRSLRGVIHAAVVYDDEFIPGLDVKSMEHVFAPKIQGTWNLHEATKSLPLDFFALFSTMAVELGTVRQANYVAANMFLDTLAAWRHRMGLPAVSIKWGALLGAGLVDRSAELKQVFESLGMPAIPLKESLHALDVILRKGEPVVGFTKVDWEKYSKINPAVCNQPRLAGNVSGSSVGEGRVLQKIAAAPKAARRSIIARYMVDEIARVLKIDPSRIGHDVPMQDFGLDSLNAFQLKNRIEADLRISLQVTNFLQKSTVKGLSETIDSEMGTQVGSEQKVAGGTGGAMRLSVRQSHILADIAKHGDDIAYTRSFDFAAAVRFRPKADVKQAREAVDRMLADNPILRTYFPIRKGAPTIRIAEEPDAVESIDCTNISDRELDAVIQHEMETPLDLQSGPLFKVKIYHRRDDSDVMLLRSHGLVVDGLSLLMALEMNFSSYIRMGFGRREAVRKSLQFSDFAHWQQGFLASPKGKTQLLYWKQKLRDLGPPIDFPCDHDRVSDVPRQSGTLPFILDKKLTARLREVADASHQSLFTLLMATFALLMRRISGRGDIPITTAASGRTRAEFDSTMGPLSNILAIRAPMNPDDPFLTYLGVLDDSLKEALIHQDYPFAEVRRALAEGGAAGATPLDQVSFSMFLPRRSQDLDSAALFGNLPGAKLRIGQTTAESVVLPPRGCRRDKRVPTGSFRVRSGVGRPSLHALRLRCRTVRARYDQGRGEGLYRRSTRLGDRSDGIDRGAVRSQGRQGCRRHSGVEAWSGAAVLVPEDRSRAACAFCHAQSGRRPPCHRDDFIGA